MLAADCIHLLSYLIYSIPFAAIKEGVFHKNFKNFPQPQGSGQGEQGQTAKKGGQICRQIAQFQQEAAEQPEVDHAPRHQARRAVQADAAAPGVQRPEEEGDRDRQPEQQIQRAAQQAQGHADPYHPKQVVQHARPHAQQHSLDHSPGLVGNGDVHGQPNSRASRPPRPPPWSS